MLHFYLHGSDSTAHMESKDGEGKELSDAVASGGVQHTETFILQDGNDEYW